MSNTSVDEPQVITPEIVKEDNKDVKYFHINETVNKIVAEWNKHVELVQNNTIKLCMMIKDMTKDYPHETVKEILKKVKNHPDIKQFVSVDRIWQGMRLMNRRPELIEFVKQPEKLKEEGEKDKPYTKKDGEIFWEYYFELEKHGLNQLEREMIENEGKRQGWSCKELRNHIQDRKDELAGKGNYHAKKEIKADAMKRCITILRTLPFNKVLDAEKLLKALRGQNESELRGATKE